MTVTFGLSSMCNGALPIRPMALADLRPVALEQPAVAHPRGVDARLSTEHSLCDLEMAHLE